MIKIDVKNKFPPKATPASSAEGIQRSVVVTYTNPGSDWASLGEVVPALEKAWSRTASEHHQVDFFRMGENSISSSLPLFLRAHKIIFLSLLPYKKMAALMILLRTKLPVRSPFVVYLYDNPSMAAWRLHSLGIGDLLRQTDLFIASCRGDLRAMKSCFLNAKVALVPFVLEEDTPPQPRAKRGLIPFAYVGRLSEQKLIHILVLSFWLLKQSNTCKEAFRNNEVKLFLWGKDDGLGSPNMGIPSNGYRKLLTDLCRRLDLVNDVHFMGHVPRDTLYRHQLNFRHIFISPGLHSDENFGMAALRSLLAGNCAVLSSWGGHRDLRKSFRQQVSQVKVRRSQEGPMILPHELARSMALMLRKFQQLPPVPTWPASSAYKLETVSGKLNQLIRKRERGAGTPFVTPETRRQEAREEACSKYEMDSKCLRKSPEARAILRQRRQFVKHLPPALELSQKEFLYNRIFKDYGDKLARPFFLAYGMEKKLYQFPRRKFHRSESFALVPWVQVTGRRIIIEDPHKGKKILPLKRSSGNCLAIGLVGTGESQQVSTSVLQWLLSQGLAFPVPKLSHS